MTLFEACLEVFFFFCAHLSKFKCICIHDVFAVCTCPMVEVWEVFPPNIFLQATKTLSQIKVINRLAADYASSKPSSSSFTILRNILPRQKFCSNTFAENSRNTSIRRHVVSLTVKHSPHSTADNEN